MSIRPLALLRISLDGVVRACTPGVRSGPVDHGRIGLTFDDGPSEATPALLALLAEHGVLATFFLCGKNVARLPHVARAIRDAGHEIGNHTETHARLCPRLGWRGNWLSGADLYQELAQAQATIRLHTGVTPNLFRAPYGLGWFGLTRAQRVLRLRSIQWTVIGQDWEWDAERIRVHLRSHVGPGAIVCLHDGRDTAHNPDITHMLSALQRLLPLWKASGLCPGTVSHLLRPE